MDGNVFINRIIEQGISKHQDKAAYLLPHFLIPVSLQTIEGKKAE